ncbi:YchJ family protein [Propionibacteriaceae bacterium G1746]|uniref:YchJ family protein n=1 Tax=Aestuariimicrobium sp. G57 TaxID=3418485 RepID=UPI003C189852
MTSESFFANAPRDLAPDADCPCGRDKAYGDCCGRYIDQRDVPPTAEACMRSRYTAYVLRNGDHLFRTWSPKTRPQTIDLENINWSGLEIKATRLGGVLDATGQVEFIAHWLLEDGHQADLHEVSDFEKRGNRWVYVSGEHHFHNAG